MWTGQRPCSKKNKKRKNRI